jgi:hypothetical protein
MLTSILPPARSCGRPRRVSVLPLLKDTAQFDDLNFVLHHSSRVLSKMFKNVAGWSPTKIQVGALSRAVARFRFHPDVQRYTNIFKTLCPHPTHTSDSRLRAPCTDGHVCRRYETSGQHH